MEIVEESSEAGTLTEFEDEVIEDGSVEVLSGASCNVKLSAGEAEEVGLQDRGWDCTA